MFYQHLRYVWPQEIVIFLCIRNYGGDFVTLEEALAHSFISD